MSFVQKEITNPNMSAQRRLLIIDYLKLLYLRSKEYIQTIMISATKLLPNVAKNNKTIESAPRENVGSQKDVNSFEKNGKIMTITASATLV